MIEKTFMIRPVDIPELSKTKTTIEICNILSDRLKIELSKEFPDKELAVSVHFAYHTMSYAVMVFIYDDHESHSYKPFDKAFPTDKYEDRFIKAKGKPPGLKI